MAVSLEQPRRMTALDAVNFMLKSVGESPVSVLGPTSKPTAVKAETLLAEYSIKVQSDGYRFAREEYLTLTPTPQGEVYLPDNILSFEPTGASVVEDLVEDGQRLYDSRRSTFIFKKDVTIKAVLARPFKHLPQPARWYITLVAALSFINSENPGSPALRVTSEDLSEAKRALERYDRRLAKGGLRRLNPHFKRLRGNR